MSQLHISSSPHIHRNKTTTGIMLDVIIALLPATIAGFLIFGLRALSVVMMCIAVCVLSEAVFNRIAKKTDTIGGRDVSQKFFVKMKMIGGRWWIDDFQTPGEKSDAVILKSNLEKAKSTM